MSTATIPIFAPDGTLGEVPYDQMTAALKAGGKLGVHMRAPDGTEGIIPVEHIQEAFKAGGKVIPWDLSKVPMDSKKGIWDTFVDDVKEIFSSPPQGVSPYPGTDLENKQRMAQESREHYERQKAAGYSTQYAVATRLVPANTEGMERAAAEGNSDAVLGHMLAGQALAMAPLAGEQILRVSPKVISAAGKAVPAVKEAGAAAFRTEEGAGVFKPGAKAAAQVVGAAAGAAPGLASGNLYASGAGGVAGYKLGPSLAEALFPPKTVPLRELGAPFPSAEEFYANRGAEMNAVRRQTATMERAAAREQETTTRAQAKEAQPVPITQSPNYDPGAFRAGASGRTTATPKIYTPSEGAPKVSVSEGRPATWTNERVIQLASDGNRDAIAQAVRRGFMLPENARYIMGDENFSAGVSNPRSVTKFTPTGEPITQGERTAFRAAKPKEPIYAYRTRTVGEEGIKASDLHAHASLDSDEIDTYMSGRQSAEENRTGQPAPQEKIKFNLTNLKEGRDYVRVHRAGQPDWIRVLRDIPEGDIQKVKTQ